MDSESLALITMWLALISGLLTVFMPWLLLTISRPMAYAAATILAFVATTSFLVSNIFMPSSYNIRVDLLIIPVILVCAYGSCVGLIAYTRSRTPQ